MVESSTMRKQLTRTRRAALAMEAERTVVEGARERVQSLAPPDHHTDGQQAIIAASGISPRLWRMYANFWLVCLLFPILALVQTGPEPLRLVVALAGLVIFVISYFWVMWPHPLRRDTYTRKSLPTALMLLAALTALVLVLSLVDGSAFLWLYIGVGAIAGVTLPARSAFVAVILLTLLTLGVAVGLSGGVIQVDWLHIIPLALLVRGLGLDMIGLARLASALQELDVARGELARLAVIEERMRMARDLHDLLGHHLSLITLKSELAGRLLEAAPARAAAEIQEIARVARQTLREVREAVAGYRQPTLHSELDGAQQLLSAAGIACTIEHTAEALPPATDAVLAWAVREAVTNVIRHSRARQCCIRITGANGTVHAEVTNDGYRGQRQEGDGARRRTGSGLAGLAERVRAHGGSLEAGPWLTDGQEGFRLWVELPTRSTAPAIEERRP
jgi:two-component system, NarL family, sensor histidine kinase DesK